MTPTQRAAMEQALEALILNCGGHTEGKAKDSIAALRAALAEQPAEPVPAQVNPAFQAIADAEAAEAESEYLRRLREQDCSQNIESPFNGCMYKGYCLSLKAKLELEEEASHHCPVLPELEAQINVALGLETPTAQQVREFARSGGSAIVTGHQEYTFTDERLHKFVLAAIKKFAPQPAKHDFKAWFGGAETARPYCATCGKTRAEHEVRAEQVPAAEIEVSPCAAGGVTAQVWSVELPVGTHKLYTAPQPAKRVPLIADEICDAWEFITGHQIQFGPSAEGRPMFISTDEVIEFARAIEAAHGITGETK